MKRYLFSVIVFNVYFITMCRYFLYSMHTGTNRLFLHFFFIRCKQVSIYSHKTLTRQVYCILITFVAYKPLKISTFTISKYRHLILEFHDTSIMLMYTKFYQPLFCSTNNTIISLLCIFCHQIYVYLHISGHLPFFFFEVQFVICLDVLKMFAQ